MAFDILGVFNGIGKKIYLKKKKLLGKMRTTTLGIW